MGALVVKYNYNNDKYIIFNCRGALVVKYNTDNYIIYNCRGALLVKYLSPLSAS